MPYGRNERYGGESGNPKDYDKFCDESAYGLNCNNRHIAKAVFVSIAQISTVDSRREAEEKVRLLSDAEILEVADAEGA